MFLIPFGCLFMYLVVLVLMKKEMLSLKISQYCVCLWFATTRTVCSPNEK